MRINNSPQKEYSKVTINTILLAIVLLVIIIALVMLREIFPDNDFITKYFNKGYLVIEVLILVAISWVIDVWLKNRNKKKRKSQSNNKK